MKILQIVTTKPVLKTKKELEIEKQEHGEIVGFYDRYKSVALKKPIYIIEMSSKEFQLVSFYIELESRKPITNLELKAEIKSIGLRDSKGRFIKRR